MDVRTVLAVILGWVIVLELPGGRSRRRQNPQRGAGSMVNAIGIDGPRPGRGADGGMNCRDQLPEPGGAGRRHAGLQHCWMVGDHRGRLNVRGRPPVL